MTKSLIITFTFLVFMANQSLAAMCAQACQQDSIKIQSEIEKTNNKIYDCHEHGKQFTQPESSPECVMAYCSQSAVEVVFSAKQSKDNIDGKDLLGNKTNDSDLSRPLKDVLLSYSAIPTSPKIRLHLRLRRLLI